MLSLSIVLLLASRQLYVTGAASTTESCSLAAHCNDNCKAIKVEKIAVNSQENKHELSCAEGEWLVINNGERFPDRVHCNTSDNQWHYQLNDEQTKLKKDDKISCLAKWQIILTSVLILLLFVVFISAVVLISCRFCDCCPWHARVMANRRNGAALNARPIEPKSSNESTNLMPEPTQPSSNGSTRTAIAN